MLPGYLVNCPWPGKERVSVNTLTILNSKTSKITMGLNCGLYFMLCIFFRSLIGPLAGLSARYELAITWAITGVRGDTAGRICGPSAWADQ